MKVSVIIPVYNQSNFIGEAIASLISQTVLAAEIIVVDDGSTDNLEISVDKYKDQIKLIRLPINQGVSVARNIGVNHAQNGIILFQDADDISLPNRIELCVAALADENVNMVQGMICQFSAEENESKNDARRIKNDISSHQIGTCVLAFKKEVFINTGEFDPNLKAGGEDLDWVMRALKKGYELKKIDEIFIRKRIHASNMSLIKRDDEANIRLQMFRKNVLKK